MTKHPKTTPKTVRRSVAIPARLVDEVTQLASPQASKNWNRLVITALEEYAARRRRLQFEETMTAMAADPSIRAENKSINKTFQRAEQDGLKP